MKEQIITYLAGISCDSFESISC